MEKYIDAEIVPVLEGVKIEMAKYRIGDNYLLPDHYKEHDTLLIGKIVRGRINKLVHKDWIYKWMNI